MLQISIPVFEGLVPEQNKPILDLLFDLCIFHCLAKFRLHSNESLQMLDERTTELGKSLQSFEEQVCMVYDTQEIPKETAARSCRNAKKANEGNNKGKRKAADAEPTRKAFNLSTYKIHALGHYVQFIRLYGTTDNYTTQIGELEHCQVKHFYAHTNRTFKFVHQVTALEKRKRIVESIKLRQQESSHGPTVPFEHSNPLPVTSPKLHYKISDDTSVWTKVQTLMDENPRDPAVQVHYTFYQLLVAQTSFQNFYIQLKEHLYSRFTRKTENITIDDRGQVDVQRDRIYSHKVLRINYTTYDKIPLILVLVQMSWFGLQTPAPHIAAYQQVDFLWVRWFTVDRDQGKLDLTKKQLPRVSFTYADEESFRFGKTKLFMGPSNLGRKKSDNDEDWAMYYVGVFSDQDMFTHFIPSLGLGHVSWAGRQEPEQEAIIEEGSPDDNDTPLQSAIPEAPPEDQTGEVEVEVGNESELKDYGYVDSDGEDEDEVVEDVREEDLGPEDGEEPVNHDMDVMDMEGYGLL
ncbi:hypothetical protein VKT23_010580 [Stygiomarasmius scandens]|uniref:Uncharacterized protein n=1 Tax=Marasmiellus scandens TaxID=2682957 RepID=A0ABR1JGC7_9AGAR